MWAADDVRSGKIMYLRIYIHEPLKPSKIKQHLLCTTQTHHTILPSPHRLWSA